MTLVVDPSIGSSIFQHSIRGRDSGEIALMPNVLRNPWEFYIPRGTWLQLLPIPHIFSLKMLQSKTKQNSESNPTSYEITTNKPISTFRRRKLTDSFPPPQSHLFKKCVCRETGVNLR